MATHKMDDQLQCPSCKAITDGARNLEDNDQRPAAGDMTVCAYCARILAFVSENELREITRSERANIEKNHPVILEVVAAVRKMNGLD